jgi:hypothetical protein
MAPPLNATEAILTSHAVAITELPLAFILSLLVGLVVFLAVYVICMIQSLDGKLDLIYNKESGKPFNSLKIDNPFKRFTRYWWRNPFTRETSNSSVVGIVLNDDISSAVHNDATSENHTDSEIC